MKLFDFHTKIFFNSTNPVKTKSGRLRSVKTKVLLVDKEGRCGRCQGPPDSHTDITETPAHNHHPRTAFFPVRWNPLVIIRPFFLLMKQMSQPTL